MKSTIYKLTITAYNIQSTDQRFTLDNLCLGDDYQPVEVYFQSAQGDKIYRQREKGERLISNQTLPRLVCQLFEQQLEQLSNKERLELPTVRYKASEDMIRGVYPTVVACQQGTRKTLEYVRYHKHDGELFVLHCWNVFSTLLFAQECLRRFGQEGDCFILKYEDKPQKNKNDIVSKGDDDIQNEMMPLSYDVLQAKNIILHGAPGTGKTHLAKQVAADIVSGGQTKDIEQLSEDEKQHIAFVQFHPSYDYSDFVEGLRPVLKEDGTMGFELKDGIFKSFVKKAQNDNQPYVFIIDEINRGELSKIFGELFFALDPSYRGKKSTITTQYANLHADDEPAFYIPSHVYIIGTMNDIDRSVEPFDFAMRRRFRFIQLKPEEHIEMLDCLDEETKNDALQRMIALNRVIAQNDELGEAYCIGAAYFLKLAIVTVDQLWSDYLYSLIGDYVQGLYDGQRILQECASAYYLNNEVDDDSSM